MNYLLKRQASPCVVECFVNNSKRNKLISCYCYNCLRLNLTSHNNVPKFRSSSYIAAAQEANNKESSKKTRSNRLKGIKLITQENAKKTLLNKKKSGVLHFKSKYNLDSTQSYDPNYFTPIMEVDRYQEEFTKHSRSKTSKSKKFPVMHLNVETNSQNSVERKNEGFNYKEIYNEDTLHQYKPEAFKNNMDTMTEPECLSSDEKNDDMKNCHVFSVPLTEHTVLVDFLRASMDICYTNGTVMKAFEMLRFFRRKLMWKQVKEKNRQSLLSVYNPLLFALADKGYWHMIQVVNELMIEDKVKLNFESLAAHLLCLAIAKDSGSEVFMHTEVKAFLDRIFVLNISLNDIFSKSKLSKENYEKILSVIRLVIPSFEVEPDVIELNSDCPLLKKLYSESRANLSHMGPPLENWGADDAQRVLEKQKEVEKNFFIPVQAVSSLQDNVDIRNKNKAIIEKYKDDWRKSLTQAIVDYQNATEEELKRTPVWTKIHLFLNCLPADQMVDILMETTLNIIEYRSSYTPCCHMFTRRLGNMVYERYQLRKNEITGYSQKSEELMKKYLQWFFRPSGPNMNYRQKWQMLIQDSEKCSKFGPQVVQWPDVVITRVGKFMLDLILRNVQYPVLRDNGVEYRPVFYTILRNRSEVYRLELRCHPTVATAFENVGFDILNYQAREIPMLCPPKPWKSADQGGYLFCNSDLIRKPFSTQGRVLVLDDMPQKQLYASFDALNVLQSVPWRVNEELLDVALEVFKSGGSEKLSVPIRLRKLDLNHKLGEMSFVSRVKELRKKKELAREYANNYGLWCEYLYRLSLANHYRKEIFWLPHNFDFRGRVYPVPPLLSYMGSDLFRSLFLFAEGKPLGPKGFDWLKVHLVNLTGILKKSSVECRLKYANKVLPEILDSAEKPLTGKKWWMESEEPWQTLAACMEVKKVVSSPDPESYVSGFPIHQDGSCNGLQHYAALGRDVIGAKSVNLAPSEVPQDVYALVADLVERQRAEDAENGVNIAKILEGFIERKVVKQTVMTTVYGVTPYGAKLQIDKRLSDIPNFPEAHIKTAAAYLSEKIFNSLRQMFESAKDIQDWLTTCSTEICKAGEYVQWVSPIGLPVLQYYGKFAMDKDTKTKKIVPNGMKQRNAFPPNFIHSLDSCHMMLTALYCRQAGLTFSAVHDCFWTHPSTVDIMNRICREQFISLHNQTILEDLSAYFQRAYEKQKSKALSEIFSAVPKKGNFDINEVLKSVYFFS